jgi:hypothetical protein
LRILLTAADEPQQDHTYVFLDYAQCSPPFHLKGARSAALSSKLTALNG